MSDTAINLFGRRIVFSDDQAAGIVEDGFDLAAVDHSGELAEKNGCIEAASDARKDHSNVKDLDRNNADDTSDLNNVNDVEVQASCLDDKVITNSKTEQEHVNVDVSSQEKVLKKPDKILPCPRCSSMDTKFCYYNNYNVNQPRHFCRKCQRYWTAGGTIRNVPVGAGRRKNKHSSSQFRQLTISDAPSSPRVKNPCSNDSQLRCLGNSTPTSSFNGNGRAFKVSQDSPPCIPTTDVLIAERKGKAEVIHVACGENINEPPCLSSTITSICMRKENSENTARLNEAILAGPPNGLTRVNPLQCYPVPTWAYPWNAGWGNITGIASGQCAPDIVYGQESGGPKLVPWSPPAMLAAPAFCAPNTPYPFLPASFWGCMPPWPNEICNLSSPGVNGILSASLSTSNSRFSGSNSPTLGKHSREAVSHAAEKKEKSLWVPKTLRIDDPDEAARSSIWETLGIKCDRSEPVAKGRIFKSFHHRTETEDQNNDTTQVRHANPAALSRSNTFQEST